MTPLQRIEGYFSFAAGVEFVLFFLSRYTRPQTKDQAKKNKHLTTCFFPSKMVSGQLEGACA
jgi:hypothetical protein